MRVAFYSYPSAFQNPGGGEVQLLKTKEYLEKSGVEVKLFDQWSDDLDDFDFLHVFGSVKDCVGLMETSRNKGVKVALSSIFWSSFKRALYEGPGVSTKADLFARHLAKIVFPRFPSGRRRTMLLSDVIFPNSEMEKQQLKRLFGIRDERIRVVPNAIDERFLDADPGAFRDKFGTEDFVLAVGRIEPRKNQLNLIKAMKGSGLKLVVVGDPVSDYAGYYDMCRKESGSDVVFTGGFRHGEGLLESAYAACSVFAAPGWFETPGLAALEAAAAGAPVAITKYGCTMEYFGEDADYFDPSDPRDIRKAVLRARTAGKERTQSMKERIKTSYLWENTARETLRGYESVIKD